MDGSSIQIRPRPRHERPADRDHLLLATRQRAGNLAAALLHAGEQAVDSLQILVEFGAFLAGYRRPFPGFRTRSFAETAAAPPARGPIRDAPRSATDRRSMGLPSNSTEPVVGPDDAHDGLHRRRLAASIAAQQTDDFAGGDVVVHILQNVQIAVMRVDVAELQQRRPRRGSVKQRAISFTAACARPK